MRALVFEEFGPRDVLHVRDVPEPVPGPGQVALRVATAGLNNFDLQVRRGHAGFPVPLPLVGGMEAVGVVAAVGEGVEGWAPGQRALRDVTDSCRSCRWCRSGREWRCVRGAFTLGSISGAFGEILVCDASRLVALPDAIADDVAAAIQMSYGTAFHMLTARARLQAGETVLVSSVGSGLGAAAADIARRAGAFVIGTASTPEKVEAATARGLDAGIDHTTTDVAAEAMRLTDGAGVDVAFEHVGGDALRAALDSLAMDGRLVTCGWHGGRTVELDLLTLARGRRTLIGSVNRTLDDLHRCIDLVARGELQPAVAGVFDLADARNAIALMEERRAFGKLVLRVAA